MEPQIQHTNTSCEAFKDHDPYSGDMNINNL